MRSVIKKGKRTAWNKRKDKTMTLDTQVNLAESDKGFFYNQKEWLEEYGYGKGTFYSECDDDENYTSSEDNDSSWEGSPSEEDKSSDSNTGELSTAYSCRIVFFLGLPPFFSNLLLLLSCNKKKLRQCICGTMK